MQDIEYIFVNDCTPDHSIQVLQSVIDEYPQRKSDIKIISHEKTWVPVQPVIRGLKQPVENMSFIAMVMTG